MVRGEVRYGTIFIGQCEGEQALSAVGECVRCEAAGAGMNERRLFIDALSNVWICPQTPVICVFMVVNHFDRRRFEGSQLNQSVNVVWMFIN